ncbi:hypothetical protein AAFN60_04355 [Roseibacillus persicicus]|uniref:hypothetical protein n=1 Tax=Roseibacillus persicicus TaxID=454148 RepID=UPI00398BA7E8
MKILALLTAIFASLGQLSAQVYAIITVEFTEASSNQLRSFVIQLDHDHAPRSVAAFMLLAEPQEKYYRNTFATLGYNPAGQYVPANEDGSPLLPASTIYRILVDNNDPTTGYVVRQASGTVMATLTFEDNEWTSDNSHFSVSYNSTYQRYTLTTNTTIPYFDSTDNYYRNKNPISSSNPKGEYIPSQSTGASASGATAYIIAADSLTPTPSEAFLLQQPGNVQVAKFTRVGTGNTWTSDNPSFTLNSNPSSTTSRFIITEDVSLTPTLTSGEFYGNDDMVLVEGDHPFLSIGKSKATANQANGLVFQNEVVDVNHATFSDADLWGARFATSAGLVGNAQRYAVAFANAGVGLPNTAGGEILITGFYGNPDYDGRHTHIGNVISGTYFPLGGGAVAGSRVTVDQILAGEPAELRAINFEISNSNFDPIEYVSPLLADVRLPRPSVEERSTPCADFSGTRRSILSGGEPGQLRFLERSDDFSTWTLVGKSGYPLNADSEYGLNVDWPSQTGGPSGTRLSIMEKYPRSFFRTLPMVIDHPQWPAADFEDQLPNADLSLKGRVVDGDNPQVLNVFNIFLNSTGDAGILQGIGGDLSGTHELTSVTFEQTSPMIGELTMVGETLPETLRLRLYFDSHKGGELTGGRNPIERFHRITTEEVTVGGNTIIFEQVSEFGIWVSND